MRFFNKVGLGLVLAFLPLSALAEEGADQGDSDLTFEWTPVPVLKTKDGKFEVKLRGRAFLDHAWVNDSDNTLNLAATEFRTARMGINGKYGKRISFRFEADFAHKTVTYKDIFLQWKGPVTVKIGHIKFATPMESSSSSRFLPFMERGGLGNAFFFGRQMSVSITKTLGRGQIQFGIGQGGFAARGSDSTGFRVAARINQAIDIGSAVIHFGASFSHLTVGNTRPNFQYRERPVQHLAPRFINTGRVADSHNFFGLEAGVFSGPFALVGETGFLKADLAAPLPGQSDPSFWAGHITASYFLTGEDSPYNRKNGAYDRPKVKKPLLKGGPGAVQVALRYDYIDLVDQGIFGGIQKTVVVGVNWWWANHIKMVFNYSHSDISQAFLVAANGADGANKVNAFGIRTQIDW